MPHRFRTTATSSTVHSSHHLPPAYFSFFRFSCVARYFRVQFQLFAPLTLLLHWFCYFLLPLFPFLAPKFLLACYTSSFHFQFLLSLFLFSLFEFFPLSLSIFYHCLHPTTRWNFGHITTKQSLTFEMCTLHSLLVLYKIFKIIIIISTEFKVYCFSFWCSFPLRFFAFAIFPHCLHLCFILHVYYYYNFVVSFSFAFFLTCTFILGTVLCTRMLASFDIVTVQLKLLF